MRKIYGICRKQPEYSVDLYTHITIQKGENLHEHNERKNAHRRAVSAGRRRDYGGAGAVVLPGVTIGDNTVVGAGSIVTKDLPANVLAVGNPCRVVREISEHDREYYYKDRKIDYNSLKTQESS